jgi:hypothetical protein
MATKKATKKTTENQVSTLDELADFKPAFDKATMYRIEANAGAASAGQFRRVALAVLTMTADELSAVSRSDAVVYDEMTRATASAEQLLKELHHLARAAALRLEIADCRDAA